MQWCAACFISALTWFIFCIFCHQKLYLSKLEPTWYYSQLLWPNGIENMIHLFAFPHVLYHLSQKSQMFRVGNTPGYNQMLQTRPGPSRALHVIPRRFIQCYGSTEATAAYVVRRSSHHFWCLSTSTLPPLRTPRRCVCFATVSRFYQIIFLKRIPVGLHFMSFFCCLSLK